jgi:hypothetical protein
MFLQYVLEHGLALLYGSETRLLLGGTRNSVVSRSCLFSDNTLGRALLVDVL